MNTVILSVIVPVYNGEDTLDRCIQSIVKQTYEDFELLIVNDGSTDTSLAIAKKYEQKDERVRVLSQENKGVSAARNHGVKKAHGKWITFVDADDYLDTNCFQKVLANEKIDSVELAFWNRKDVYRNRLEEKRIFADDEWKQYSIQGLIENVFYNPNGNLEMCSACCRLFRRDIVSREEIWFDNTLSMGEDLIFMLDYLKVTSQFCYIDNAMYYRSMSENSAMHGFHPQIGQSLILLLDKIREHLDISACKDVRNAYQIYVLRGPVTTYLESYLCNSQNKNGRKQRAKELRNFLKTDIIADAMKEIRYGMLPDRLKVKLFCIRHSWMTVLDHWYRRKEYV